VPKGIGVEVAAVVGVTVGPVFAVQEFFAEAGDGTQVGPCSGVRFAGENHTVVEENSFHLSHEEQL